MLHIETTNEQDSISIINLRFFEEIAETVLTGEQITNAEISIAFVDNPTIHKLNVQYLNHDEPTDVLSFPLSEPAESKLVGELVIGAEVAAAEAKERGHTVEAELALYVIHGLLHLCGFDDKSLESTQQMRRRERHYLQVLGLPAVAGDE